MFLTTPVRTFADYLRWRLPTWWRCTRPCTRSGRSLRRSTSHIKSSRVSSKWPGYDDNVPQSISADDQLMLLCKQTSHFTPPESTPVQTRLLREVREAAALATWQPRTARRKVRTVGDMGAAPVTITRTRPPRDSYRRGRGKVYPEPINSRCSFPERRATCTLWKMSLSHRLFFLMTPSFTSANFLSTAKFSSHFLKGVVAPLWTCGGSRLE